MENKELNEILFLLDSDRGRTTKIRILKLIKKRKLNTNEISSMLRIKSYSHVNKFLKILYDLFLVDFDEISFSKEHFSYVKREWKLTDLGYEIVDALKDISLLRKTTPKMFLEKLKREIRSSEKYKAWREEVLNFHGNACISCGMKGNCLQAHHIIELAEIIEKNNIDSIEKALKCEALFDIENGECLCSHCHILKHNPETK
ncbi:MAG TPA: HNH endonuclease signature motif containing protein [Bacillota bacterium]|nr:HNH endonuclease signature motif containing protein [Bacillota bacterium]